MAANSKSGAKGLIGLIALGLAVGAILGWFFGNVMLGAAIGLVVALVLVALHLLAVKSGVVYTRTAAASLSEAPSAPRNHVICIDGTWNHPDVPTNVRKCFEALWPKADNKRVKSGTSDDGTVQIAKYYRGVGARENIGPAYEFLKKRYSKTKFAGVTGYGVQSILYQAYFDFVEDYREGDRIFIFGFSRGAAIARMLANYISKTYGLPESVEIRYQKSKLRRNPFVHKVDVHEPLKHGTREIEFLGLWDTVAALGVPGNHTELFKDLTLSENVKTVCHLVAIDEVRKEFDATLFDQDDRVEEIWMPGAHTNVGGGWEDDSGLSDIALRLMLDRARQNGLVFTPGTEEVDEDVSGPVWEAGPIWLLKITREIVVQAGASGHPPRIHPAVFRRIDKKVPGHDGEPYDPTNVKALAFSREELEHPA